MGILILTDFIVFGLVGWMWYRGGKNKSKFIRRVLIPILLSIYLAIKLKTWWILLTIGGGLQTGGIGYGAYDPENDDKPSFLALWLKDRSGEWIRLTWSVIVSLAVSISLKIANFLNYGTFIGYVLLNSIIGFLVSKLKLSVKLTDFLVGLAIGSIVFWVKRT